MIEEMCYEIECSPEEPTCQLFTGHIGCGKSTELMRLKSKLEDEGFYVVYFESHLYLAMEDLDITDILMVIVRQVIGDLNRMNVEPRMQRLFDLLRDVMEALKDFGISFEELGGIGVPIKFFTGLLSKIKDSPALRKRLRLQMESRTNGILDAINQDLLEPAVDVLRQKGKNGLVVIVDNLDRVESTPKATGKPQPEYLFVDRGEQLKRLNCHVVYTIPLELTFSDNINVMIGRFGSSPYKLPMVPVQHRDMTENEKGMDLIRQMVMARAFPHENDDQRRRHITEIFDTPETLDRLCRVSGGHVREVLQLLRVCIRKERRLPISGSTLENVIRDKRNDSSLGISDEGWHLLKQVTEDKRPHGDEQFQKLLRGMFVFEYRDSDGSWFDLNPVLADARELKA